jgi:DNA transformation protein and related proteins
MATDQHTKEYSAYLEEMLQCLGPVFAKRMFSGYGFFLDEKMFAIYARDTFYLKADMETRLDFEARNLAPFTYTKSGKTYALGYFEAPPEVLDDATELHRWASKAYATAQRVVSKKTRHRGRVIRKGPAAR